MKVPFNDLTRIHHPLNEVFHKHLDTILETCAFVGDTKFAEAFKEYTGANHCVTCNSGTDALYIAIKSLELPKGSKIAVPAVSYAATAMAVVNAGNNPVFIDVDKQTGLMLVNDVKQVDCVIPVHLFGQTLDIRPLLDLGVPIIEDCAQAHGADVGHTGVIGCFSFYPGKNLGALGDAGACITNDEQLAIKMKRYASLGSPKDNRYDHVSDGVNSRMDGLQGLFMLEKLKHINSWTAERMRIGETYRKVAKFPERSSYGKDVYHVFYTLESDRESYIKYMNDKGVQTGIHYPIALPELECFKEFHSVCENAREFCKSCVSLPLFPYMTEDEIMFTLNCHRDYHLQA